MSGFFLGRYFWQAKLVSANDPVLIDRTGKYTLGVTDPNTLHIYLADGLPQELRIRVMLHEIAHCCMFSFGLIDDIHRMVYPSKWIEAEEWVCNFIADYGITIFASAYRILGEEVWSYIAQRLEVIL